MAGYADDYSDDSDAPLLILLLVGGYIAYNYMRNQQAQISEAGGLDFPGYAPPTSEFQFGDTGEILSPLQVSPSGENFIMRQEGFTATPAPDAGGHVIGYGHTIQPGENFQTPMSPAQAQALLDSDLVGIAATLNNNILVEVSQNQFDALASFVYNVGQSAFINSTLLKKLNQGDYAGASAQFAAWNKSQGQTNTGLVARRNAESGLFNT